MDRRGRPDRRPRGRAVRRGPPARRGGVAARRSRTSAGSTSATSAREFGDPDPVDDATLDEVRRFDAAMLDRAAAADPAGWFGTAAEVNNRWRVCGLAATYTMLHAMGPARGRLLKYRPGGRRPADLLRHLRQRRLRRRRRLVPCRGLTSVSETETDARSEPTPAPALPRPGRFPQRGRRLRPQRRGRPLGRPALPDDRTASSARGRR